MARIRPKVGIMSKTASEKRATPLSTSDMDFMIPDGTEEVLT